MADVIQAQYVGLRTMANGCVRMTFDAPLEHLPRIVGLFGKEGDPAAIARLTDVRSEMLDALAETDGDEIANPSDLPQQRRKWDDMPPAQQAGIRCADPQFYEWVRETYEKYSQPDEVPEWLRSICGVKSRSDLNSDPEAEAIWRTLDRQFQSWLTTQKYGEMAR